MENVLTTEPPINKYYAFDPSAGIICTACRFPIAMTNGWNIERCIHRHETTVKAHKKSNRHPLDKNQQTSIASSFKIHMKDCATQVRRCLPCKATANRKFLSLVGSIQSYDYCSKCNVLTADKEKHNSRKCIPYFSEQKDGVKSIEWLELNPKVIVVDEFDLDDEYQLHQYVHCTFLEIWYNAISVEKTSMGMDTTTNDIFDSLRKQQLVFDEQREQITVRGIDNKITPNLYVTELSWDTALSGCRFSTICEMKQANRFGKYGNGIDDLLNRFNEALWYGLGVAKTLKGQHPVLRSIGTKNGGQSDKALHLELRSTTWKCYFLSVKMICLILFRMKDVHEKRSGKLPVILFTKQQIDLMELCVTGIFDENSQVECHKLHLKFILSLIDQDIGNHSYECPLIGAVSMLSVNSNSYLKATQLSKTMAGVLTTFRMLLVYDCIEQRDTKFGIEANLSDSSQFIQTIANKNAIRYLHINNKTYFTNPLRELINCFFIVFNEGKAFEADEILVWSEKKDAVTYRGIVPLPMELYPQSVCKGLGEAKTLLLRLLGYSDLPTIPWGNIVDDHGNSNLGYSFLSEYRNENWIQSEYFQKRIVTIKKSWWDGDLKDCMELFADSIDKFRSILFALIHVTGGMPPRGTEISNIAFENPTESMRNITIETGGVRIRTIYHKTMTQHGKIKPIDRYLPKAVGDLLVHYLWLVLPFWRLVKGKEMNAKESSPFLVSTDIVLVEGAKDTLWDTTRLSKCLKLFFGINGINVQSYRQIAIGVFEEKLKFQNDDSNNFDDNDGDHIYDQQAAHSTLTRRRNYAITSKINKNYDTFHDVSMAWHEFLRCSHNVNSDCRNTSSDDDIAFDGIGDKIGVGCTVDVTCVDIGSPGSIAGSSGVGIGEPESAVDIGSPGSISGSPYGVNSGGIGSDFGMSPGDGIGIDDIDFTDVMNDLLNDTEYHEKITFDYGCEDDEDDENVIDSCCNDFDSEMIVHHDHPIVPIMQPTATGNRITPIDSCETACLARRTLQYETTDSQILLVLQKVLKNPLASFRGNQMQAISSIIQHTHKVVVQICGTGTGKSCSFIIPGLLLYGGTCIVITPLVSLQADHLANARAAGINNTVIWDETTSDLALIPTMIFISPESFTRKRFQEYFVMLQNNLLLDRIVVDECHLILEASNSFRPDMLSMISIINCSSVQVILLTATMPLVDGKDLCSLLEKFNHEIDSVDVVVYRDTTIRINIQYLVEEVVSNREMNETIIRYLTKFTNEITIIYVPYVDNGVKLQSYLEDRYSCKIGLYHSKSGSTDEKNDTITNWINTTNPMKVIIATTALGCGLNIANVRLVIHAGAPFSLTDYVQGSGRAGRNCSAGTSVLIHNTNSNVTYKMMEMQQKSGMFEYLQQGVCRRITIDRYMDGDDGKKPRSGCNPGEAPCDVCIGVGHGKTLVLPINDAHMSALPSVNRYRPLNISRPIAVKQLGSSKVHVTSLSASASASALTSTLASTSVFTLTSALTSASTSASTLASAPASARASAPSPSAPASAPASASASTSAFVNQALLVTRAQLENQRLFHERENATIHYDEKMKDYLKYFANKKPNTCLICKLMGTQKCTSGHSEMKQDAENKRKAVNAIVSIRNKNRTDEQTMPNYVLCFKPGCYVPQFICPPNTKNKCLYGDILLDVVFHIMSLHSEASSLVYDRVGGKPHMYRLLTVVLEHNSKYVLLHELFLILCSKYVALQAEGL